jgi:hypothetical protein
VSQGVSFSGYKHTLRLFRPANSSAGGTTGPRNAGDFRLPGLIAGSLRRHQGRCGQETFMTRNVRTIADDLERDPFPVSIILTGIVVALDLAALIISLMMQ